MSNDDNGLKTTVNSMSCQWIFFDLKFPTCASKLNTRFDTGIFGRIVGEQISQASETSVWLCCANTTRHIAAVWDPFTILEQLEHAIELCLLERILNKMKTLTAIMFSLVQLNVTKTARIIWIDCIMFIEQLGKCRSFPLFFLFLPHALSHIIYIRTHTCISKLFNQN